MRAEHTLPPLSTIETAPRTGTVDGSRSSLLAPLGHGAATALRRPLVAICLLLAAVFTAYLPAFDAQFIWDDRMLVVTNGLIRSPLFVLESFRHTLFEDQSIFYRPTQTLVFIADYWLGGNQPFVYHFTSILIHALNGVLLFLLLRRLLPTLVSAGSSDDRESGHAGRGLELIAWVLALVWALYPIHSATVDYVSGSADSLAMLFSLLAWLGAGNCLAAPTTRRRVAWAAFAAGCLLAGFCSKEIAAVWLVLFALHLFFFSRRRAEGLRPKLVLIAAALLVYAGYAALRHIPAMPMVLTSSHHSSRVVTALRALGDYGSLLVFPGKLLMERQVYPAPNVALSTADNAFYQSLTAGGVLLLVVFAAGCAWRGTGRRLRCFGVCWFLGGFLPVSNLFVTINADVAEHWLYLPSIGFLLFAAGCVWQTPTRRLRVAALACALIAATAFGARTYWRAFDWMDEFSFFSQTVADGGDVPRARVGYANAFSRRKADGAAIDILRQVTAANPGDLAAQANLSNALGRQGLHEEAKASLEKVFVRATKAEPHLFLIVLNNLDPLEANEPRWPVARAAALAQQRHLHPDSWDLMQYDTLAMLQSGQAPEAAHMVGAFARSHWWHYPSWYLLGGLCAESGRVPEALAAFKQASRLDVHDADALAAAAQVCSLTGQVRQATELQGAAVDRQPESPHQRMVFSRLLETAKQPAESTRQLAIATALLSKAAPVVP